MRHVPGCERGTLLLTDIWESVFHDDPPILKTQMC